MFNLIAKISPECSSNFLQFPHWYEYLNVGSQTTNGETIKCQVLTFSMPGDLVLVAVAVIDILIHIAGLVAIIFVIYGGIQYVTSQGSPDATAKAQSTIINALISLALAVIAVGFVSFMGNRLGS
jgi:hypothetical protein